MSAIFWAVVGLIFVGLDVASVGATGFVSMVIGVAMLVVALLTQGKILEAVSAQCVATAFLSVLGLVFSRRVLAGFKRRPQDPSPDSLIGVSCISRGQMDVGAEGHVALRGTLWQAKNTSMHPIPAGALCEVTQVLGITLSIRAAETSSLISPEKDLL